MKAYIEGFAGDLCYLDFKPKKTTIITIYYGDKKYNIIDKDMTKITMKQLFKLAFPEKEFDLERMTVVIKEE